MDFIIFLSLFFLGWFVGKRNEKKHYRSIHQREAQQTHRPAMTFDAEELTQNVETSQLVVGSVVVAVDYFKQILSGLRLLFGGEMKSYASLIDRARREALLRMKENAPDADLFINTRLETSSISKGAKKRIGSIEMFAYSTAVKLKK